jgi:hypothetical protein
MAPVGGYGESRVPRSESRSEPHATSSLRLPARRAADRAPERRRFPSTPRHDGPAMNCRPLCTLSPPQKATVRLQRRIDSIPGLRGIAIWSLVGRKASEGHRDVLRFAATERLLALPPLHICSAQPYSKILGSLEGVEEEQATEAWNARRTFGVPLATSLHGAIRPCRGRPNPHPFPNVGGFEPQKSRHSGTGAHPLQRQRLASVRISTSQGVCAPPASLLLLNTLLGSA